MEFFETLLSLLVLAAATGLVLWARRHGITVVPGG